MKRIFYTQQKPFNYMPLRMGLGYIQAREIYNADGKGITYCPKIYTTRTHPLSGEYYVVEGSRFKARPVEPRIEFSVESTALLHLAEGLVCPVHDGKPDYESWACVETLDRTNHKKFVQETVDEHGNYVDLKQILAENSKAILTFAELDLGYKGATYTDLKNELLRLNPKATINSKFYVNKLEPTA